MVRMILMVYEFVFIRIISILVLHSVKKVPALRPHLPAIATLRRCGRATYCESSIAFSMSLTDFMRLSNGCIKTAATSICNSQSSYWGFC